MLRTERKDIILLQAMGSKGMFVTARLEANKEGPPG